MPLRLGDEIGVGQARAEDRCGDDECEEDLHDQRDEPLNDVAAEPEERRSN